MLDLNRFASLQLFGIALFQGLGYSLRLFPVLYFWFALILGIFALFAGIVALFSPQSRIPIALIALMLVCGIATSLL